MNLLTFLIMIIESFYIKPICYNNRHVKVENNRIIQNNHVRNKHTNPLVMTIELLRLSNCILILQESLYVQNR